MFSNITFNRVSSLIFGVVSIFHLISGNLELSTLCVIASGIFQICSLLEDKNGTS